MPHTVLNAQQKENVSEQLNFFPDNQFTGRLKELMQGSDIVFEDFLLLLKDCLMTAFALDTDASLTLSGTLDKNARDKVRQFGLVYDVGFSKIRLATKEFQEPLLDVYRLKERSKTSQRKIDPAFLNRLNDDRYQYYKNRTQQDAIRTVLTCEKDATVVINIPTGCGKTLVAHASVLYAQPDQVSVVIVPTTGLAIEQSQRLKDVLSNADNGQVMKHYAWHSGLDKQAKLDIRANINNGTQKALFVSPESVTSSLLPQLFDIAKQGKLANIIIDEAHLIDSWGSHFRSDFQRLAALVSSLRSVSPTPFKLLLMSATFTDRNLSTINSLFCEKGKKPVIVNGAFLRPEMTVYKTTVSKEVHLEKVLEKALLYPKPMIIYGTTKQECGEIHDALTDIGLTRHQIFTGDTREDDKEEIIALWKAEKLDIIVATSAFGVGMDKSDVRSVIHASVPENLDRYYQEIGRSGRDGRASICELIYYPEQINTAKTINNELIISIDNGSNRWLHMWDKKQSNDIASPYGDYCYVVDTTLYGTRLEKKTDANTDWNWLTLLLMQRAGLIRLFYPEPNKQELEQLEDRKEYWQKYFNFAVVDVLSDDHLHESTWYELVQKHREGEKKAQRRGLDDLLRWLRSEVALCDVLTEYYVLEKRAPVKACGGCPECREAGKTPKRVSLGELVDISHYRWGGPRADQELIMAYYNSGQTPTANDIQNIFYNLLVKKQVVAISAERTVIEQINKCMPVGFSGYWIALDSTEFDSPYPMLVVDMKKKGEAQVPFWSEETTYYLASDSLSDESHPYRKWCDTENTAMNFSNFKHYIETLNVNS